MRAIISFTLFLALLTAFAPAVIAIEDWRAINNINSGKVFEMDFATSDFYLQICQSKKLMDRKTCKLAEKTKLSYTTCQVDSRPAILGF